MDIHQTDAEFDEHFPQLNQFICDLAGQFESGQIDSWDDLDSVVHAFFNPARMAAMESAVPGWSEMASYAGGITLVHVMCVFAGMYMLPEFQSLEPEQQNLMKWVILFHDVAKKHIRGKRDNMHAFRSGVLAARALPSLGFPTTDKYAELIDEWTEYTNQSYLAHDDDSPLTPDTRRLPQILLGIENLFRRNTSAALVVKTVLLHISLHVDDMYPTPAPLTEVEIKQYIDANLFPLLRVMMLSDNEGWSRFDEQTRTRQRRDTLTAFEKVKTLIS